MGCILSNIYPSNEQASLIIKNHPDQVMKLLYSQFHGYGFSEDDFADAYTFILDKRSLYNGQNTLSTFIVQYARQFLMNRMSHYKVKKQWWNYVTRNYNESISDNISDTLEYKEIKNVLHRLINNCPNQEVKQVLHLRFQCAYKINKIAKLTSLSADRINQIIHSFTSKFKERFTEKE